VAVTLAIVALAVIVATGPKPMTADEVQSRIDEALASLTPPPPQSQLVYDAVRPSLVLIRSTPEEAPDASHRPGTSPGPGGGLGTGVIVDRDGRILTSLHVVDGASTITVTFADGTESEAQIVASQPEDDIAVLEAERLPSVLIPAILGNPRGVRIGSEAYVVGNPFGLYSSISAGVVSGLDRSLELSENGRVLRGLIQVDAAVNPGNSGGPLLNRDGQVVGIVAALINPTEEDVFVGIGLAVPIDVAGGAAGLPPY
jgi:S1-C subfamily serine protease